MLRASEAPRPEPVHKHLGHGRYPLSQFRQLRAAADQDEQSHIGGALLDFIYALNSRRIQGVGP